MILSIISKYTQILKYGSIVILALFVGYKYMSIKKDLEDYNEVKIELSSIKTMLDEYKVKYNELNIQYQRQVEASFELEKQNDNLISKIESHDYQKINIKKPKLAEKIYEKSINEYYNTFYDCKLCDTERKE